MSAYRLTRFRVVSDGMRRYTFNRLHIPTGARSVGEADAMNDIEILSLLNSWNQNLLGTWQYWI